MAKKSRLKQVKTSPNSVDLLTTPQAAEYLKSKGFRVHPFTLSNWRYRDDRDDYPPYRKVINRVFYSRTDLDSWLEQRLAKRLGV